MKRREVLGLLAVTGALVALPDSGETARGGRRRRSWRRGRPPAQPLAGLRAVGLQAGRLPAVRAQLDVMAKGLAETRTAADRSRLCRMTADLYQLVGELFFDANRYTDAAHCYTLAANAAHAGGDHDLWACAMTRHAYVELYARRAHAAQPLLMAAFRIARSGDDTLSTRHWVAAVQAQAYAAVGDLDACNRALDEAEKVHALDGVHSHNGGWLRFDGSRLAEERGPATPTGPPRPRRGSSRRSPCPASVPASPRCCSERPRRAGGAQAGRRPGRALRGASTRTGRPVEFGIHRQEAGRASGASCPAHVR